MENKKEEQSTVRDDEEVSYFYWLDCLILIQLKVGAGEYASYPETGRARPSWDGPSMLSGSGGWKKTEETGRSDVELIINSGKLSMNLLGMIFTGNWVIPVAAMTATGEIKFPADLL